MSDQWFEHFIEVTPEWGRIGNIHWHNSFTTPYKSRRSGMWVVYWGCFVPHLPESHSMYGKEKCLEDACTRAT
jgi:hypothetical protein